MILVVGATGSLGSNIVRRLLARGEQARVLVRAGSAYQPLEQQGATVSIGDLKDRASLDRACAGIDTVITTANSAKRGGDDNVDSVDARGTIRNRGFASDSLRRRGTSC